jgi:hypothetical protein
VAFYIKENNSRPYEAAGFGHVDDSGKSVDDLLMIIHEGPERNGQNGPIRQSWQYRERRASGNPDVLGPRLCIVSGTRH